MVNVIPRIDESLDLRKPCLACLPRRSQLPSKAKQQTWITRKKDVAHSIRPKNAPHLLKRFLRIDYMVQQACIQHPIKRLVAKGEVARVGHLEFHLGLSQLIPPYWIKVVVKIRQRVLVKVMANERNVLANVSTEFQDTAKMHRRTVASFK